MGPLRLVLLLAPTTVLGAITVYHVQQPLTAAPSASATATSIPPAYNPSTLVPPAVPTDQVMTTIPVALQNSGTVGMSIPQKGSFIGFSIEMSVTNQVLGKNSSLIQVPFLNLMANIQQRAGSVMVRVGGNTQESAKMVDSLPNGRILEKDLQNVSGTTQTPPLDFTADLLYLMRNISDFVNVHWFLGTPWFVTTPFDTDIVTAADNILGDYLLGMQAGNEPDMYVLHGHRNDSYGPYDYFGEFGDFLTQIAGGADPTGRVKSVLVGPNIASFAWTLEEVWDTGFVDTYNENLAFLAGEKYPNDNCGATFGAGDVVNPQDVLPNYLTHTRHQALLEPYLNSTMYAQTKNKPFLMFETNTASCGGFLGISDAFVAALWGIDYALLMAHSNFSGAMFHLGGQNVYYNPFTAPPTNQSTYHQWSVGPLYYSALIMAEAMGPSNTTQVLNLPIDGISEFTPIYGIYESGVPKRVAIVNYINDPSGANDVHAMITLANPDGTQTTPSSVKVKYLAASSVVQKGNYTWAGQTFGGFFESDGRPMGDEDVQTVQCSAGSCNVTVPAPGFALVFLTDDALSESENGGAPSATFSTTIKPKGRNTVTVDPSLLATSNGNRFADHELAGTSKQQKPSGAAAQGASALLAVILGGVVGALLALPGFGRV